jgi:hypothetical protein
LIWFRKEPTLTWVDGPGETETAFVAASRILAGALERSQPPTAI